MSSTNDGRIDPPAHAILGLPAEVFLLAAGMLLFVVCNSLTLNLVPITSNAFDEIYFSDPAVNFARGRGLTSYGQFVQPGDTLWAQHPPLYPVFLSVWYRLFGISTFSTRAFGLACSTVALLLLWMAMCRSKAVPHPWIRLFVIAVVSLCTGFSNITRSGRLDVLIQAFFCLALYGVTFASASRRWPILLFSGAAIQMTGIQLDVTLAGLAAVGVLTAGTPFLVQTLPFAVGTVIGLGCWFLFCEWNGVLQYFLGHLAVHSLTTPDGFQGRLARFLVEAPRLLITDRSYPGIIAAEVLGTALLWKSVASRRWLLASWGVVVGVPLLSGLIWKRFTNGDSYYFWPIELLGVTTFAAGWARACVHGVPRWRSAVVATPLILAAFMGAPLRHVAAVGNWRERDPGPAARLVGRHVQPDDVVLVSAGAYYPAARVAARTYTYWYAPQLSPDDISRLTLVFMPDDERAAFAYAAVGRTPPGTVIESLGPGWTIIDSVGPASTDDRVPPYNRPIRLSVLRRKKE